VPEGTGDVTGQVKFAAALADADLPEPLMTLLRHGSGRAEAPKLLVERVDGEGAGRSGARRDQRIGDGR